MNAEATGDMNGISNLQLELTNIDEEDLGINSEPADNEKAKRNASGIKQSLTSAPSPQYIGHSGFLPAIGHPQSMDITPVGDSNKPSSPFSNALKFAERNMISESKNSSLFNVK